MPVLTEDMKLVVREQSLGFVATVCPDGTPNLPPKGTTTDLSENPVVEINIVDAVPVTGTDSRIGPRSTTLGTSSADQGERPERQRVRSSRI